MSALRAKVRQWFNALELEQSITAGRDLIEKELQRLGKTAVKLDDLAKRLGFASGISWPRQDQG